MKLVFLNVWGNEMRDELVPYIEEQAVDTDIFCFQEATDHMRRSCAHVLTDYREISDYKHISDGENFSQSIFIKGSIELLSSGTLFADDISVGLAIYAEIKHGDNCAYICNAHGRSRPNEKLDNPDRLQFSQGLIEYFKEKDVPVVIGGDFNLELTTESVEMFEKHYYKDLIKEFDIKTTRNHLVWDRFQSNEMYYSDYTFINDKTRLQIFEVQNNEVSDHLPMILQIEL